MISIDIRATAVPSCNILVLMVFLDWTGAFCVSDLNSPERLVSEKEGYINEAIVDSTGSLTFFHVLVVAYIWRFEG